MLAATAGVPHRGRAVTLGVGAGVLGACLVAAFAGELAGLFQGSGQEFFNATILLLAVAMLTWHNVWMASHGREMARELKAAGHQVKTGERTLPALSIVVGVAVLREGSEVVLFLYGIAAQGGTTASRHGGGRRLGLLRGRGGFGADVFRASHHSGGQAVPGHQRADHLAGGGHGGPGGDLPAEWRLAGISSPPRCGTRPG